MVSIALKAQAGISMLYLSRSWNKYWRKSKYANKHPFANTVGDIIRRVKEGMYYPLPPSADYFNYLPWYHYSLIFHYISQKTFHTSCPCTSSTFWALPNLPNVVLTVQASNGAPPWPRMSNLLSVPLSISSMTEPPKFCFGGPGSQKTLLNPTPPSPVTTTATRSSVRKGSSGLHGPGSTETTPTIIPPMPALYQATTNTTDESEQRALSTRMTRSSLHQNQVDEALIERTPPHQVEEDVVCQGAAFAVAFQPRLASL